MKRILFLFCTLALLAGNVPAQSRGTPAPRSKWQTYTASGEEFSIALPTLPAMNTVDKFIETLQASRRERQFGAYADGVAYVIYTYENPKPQQSLEAFIEERSYHDSTSVQTGRNVTVDGVAGKVFEKEGRVVEFFATDNHLYTFAAYGAALNDPRVKKFFSSLKLGKKRAVGKEVSDGPGVPAEPADTSTAYTGRQVDQKVRMALKPEPQYTETARMNAITGTVVLKCIFNANGMVTNLIVVTGLPHGLTEQSIQAAQNIKFIPAMKEGKYVSMWMQLEYEFNLY
jgi:TonB family protein